MWNRVNYNPRSYERNLCKYVYRSLKNSALQRGFEPVTSLCHCDALTNWAMKRLTLGADHLRVLMRNYIWGISYIGLRRWNQVNCDPRRNFDLRSSQRNLCTYVSRSLKIKGFNGVWTRDLAKLLTTNTSQTAKHTLEWIDLDLQSVEMLFQVFSVPWNHLGYK